MVENTNLASFLGVTKVKDDFLEEKPSKKWYQPGSIDYFIRIGKLVNLKTAFDIVRKYSRIELAKVEGKYANFKFNGTTITKKEKLKRVLKLLEWEKDLPSIVEESYQLRVVAQSFGNLEELVQKIIVLDDSKIQDKDGLFCNTFAKVINQLSEGYSVASTSENKKTGHVCREDHLGCINVIPWATSNEIIDFLIKKEIAGQSVNDIAIVSGFDNVYVAMEVSSIVEDSLDAKTYVINGFTSMDQVSTVSLEKLKKLVRVFGFSRGGKIESSTYGGEIDVDQKWVGRRIGGDSKKLDEVIAIGKNGCKDYLIAFWKENNPIELTKEILKMTPKERPSIQSIQYARKVLKEQKDWIQLAKKIDSPYKDIFKKKFETKKQFLDFRDDYEKTVTKFMKYGHKELLTGGKVSGFDYKTMKYFEGDWNFFRYYDNIKDIKTIEESMNFNTFESEIIANDVGKDYAVRMLEKVPFKDLGIPFGMLKGLQSNHFTSQEVKLFIGMEGVKKYQQIEEGDQMVTKPIFKANDMITDLKEFYKKEKTEDLNKKNK